MAFGGVPVETVEALAARVSDGAMVAVPPDYSFVAMAATRAMIRRGVRDLHLLAVPQSGIQADMLIGAGCVAIVETAAVSLGELGAAPRFTAALENGAIAIRDSTCPAIHAGLQASEKGLPFMPLRGLIGSDLMRVREDWKESENPFEQGDRITVLPALKPDIALFHAPFADRSGNIWIGRRRELVTMAHAARATLVTVEEIRDIDLMRDEALAGGSIPALYVTAIANAPKGAWPLGLAGHYEADQAHLAGYAAAARSRQGFDDYLAEHGA
ncbi:MAG: CoA-transferase [Alphaproteobacteria bacterium]|jgi:glutaconate CoA-transferase subunit A|nr:CoA-transferase [Alphaproteobacteria bacterium]MDP6589474.1 CoA-transferase [Alphaproteobacteria bacterium]MDP6817885.1 CoA-transferase [Alphaproteobacteria bacterium]